MTPASGAEIPALGLGVYRVPPGDTQRLVEAALEVGYRHVDTAAAYVNEAGVGAAVRASGLPRDEVFVTSKLRNGDQHRAVDAYAETLGRLGLDRLDLYLVHWPNPAAGLWQGAWRGLETLLERGDVGAVGVSNFLPEHLDELAASARVLPAVDQVELHPSFQQRDVAAVCERLGIRVEAYSPFGLGEDLTIPAVVAAARAHGATPAQVVLAWHRQSGRIAIPKTVSRERLVENLHSRGLALTAAEMAAIDAADAGHRVGDDPRTFSISQIR